MTNRVDPYDVMAEEERLIVMATSRIHDAMDAARLTQAELASRIGKSASHVSQVLDGTRNMTLRTIAEFGLACGVRWTFKQVAAVTYATVCRAGGDLAAEPVAAYGPGAVAGAVAVLSLTAPSESRLN